MNVGYHLSATHSEADETRLRFECLKSTSAVTQLQIGWKFGMYSKKKAVKSSVN